jgi:hypothetical protein
MTKRIGRPKGDGTYRSIGVYGTEQEIAAVLELTPRQRIEAMLATIRDEAKAQTAAHYCEQCLTHDNLAWGPNPYTHKIFDDDTPMWLCQECREKLADEI